MGTSANVVIKQDRHDSGVFLYQHFDGPDVVHSIQTVLKSQRLGTEDTPKIASMIFRQMFADSPTQHFGISTDYAANASYFGVEIRVEEQEVEIDGTIWSFTEFANLDLNALVEP